MTFFAFVAGKFVRFSTRLNLHAIELYLQGNFQEAQPVNFQFSKVGEYTTAYYFHVKEFFLSNKWNPKNDAGYNFTWKIHFDH